MRAIINISLPQDLKEEVENAVETGSYASTSEFFRDLVRQWRRKQLLRELRESQLEVKHGKAKLLRSLRDLR